MQIPHFLQREKMKDNSVSIRIDKAIHKDLQILKINISAKSINDVIKVLLEKSIEKTK